MGQEREETELGDDREASLTPTPAAHEENEPPAPLTAAQAEIPPHPLGIAAFPGAVSPPEPCRDREQLCAIVQVIPYALGF